MVFWPPQPPAAKESRLPSPKAAGLVPPVGSPLAPSDILPGHCLLQPHPLFFGLFFRFIPTMVPRSPLYILSPTHPLFLSGLRPQGSLLASWPEHTFYWLPATLVSWGPRPFFPHTSDVDFGSLCLALFRFVWRWGAPASFFSASPFFKIKFTPHVFPFLQGSFFSVAFPSLLWFCL